jgi:hypothetical protein
MEVFDPASTRVLSVSESESYVTTDGQPASLPWNLWTSESESYVTTDGEQASVSWNKAPIWGLQPDFDYCLTVAGLLIWGALSDERTGLSFTIAAGPRQHSHFRVRVP